MYARGPCGLRGLANENVGADAHEQQQRPHDGCGADHLHGLARCREAMQRIGEPPLQFALIVNGSKGIWQLHSFGESRANPFRAAVATRKVLSC